MNFVLKPKFSFTSDSFITQYCSIREDPKDCVSILTSSCNHWNIIKSSETALPFCMVINALCGTVSNRTVTLYYALYLRKI